MPSRKKPDTTRILVQVPAAVHQSADARRRREGTPWDRVVTELLRRWAAGANEMTLTEPVKAGRPATPDAVEAERLHQQWMRENPAYARACTEKVDPAKLKWHRSLGELIAAGAAREGRTVPPGAFAELDGDGDDADAVAEVSAARDEVSNV